jgi:hypothetical protein
VHILKRSLFLHGSAHLQTLISHFLLPRVRASFCPRKISISLQLLSVSASLQTSVCIRLFSVLLSVSLSLTRHLNVFFNSDSLQNSFPLCLYVSPHPLPPPFCGNYFFLIYRHLQRRWMIAKGLNNQRGPCKWKAFYGLTRPAHNVLSLLHIHTCNLLPAYISLVGMYI